MGDTVPLNYHRQPVAHPPRMLDHRRRSPRLPTPEASRSSNGSLDEQVPRTYTRNGMRICALLSSDHSDRESEFSQQRHEVASAREDTRYRPASRSPPYHSGDSQKPSLPPLKTVLNGTISSPPDTPPTQQGTFQPGPREPSFSASTYKPPALYPNKKPRTEAGTDHSLTINTRSGVPSASLSTAPVDQRNGHSFQRPSASQTEYESGRRQSLYHSVPARPDQTPPERANYHYSRELADGGRSQRMSVSTSGPYRSPEHTAFSLSKSEAVYAQPRQATEYFASSGSDRYAIPSDRTMSRRSSAVSPHEIDSHAMADAARGGYTPTRSSHFTLPMRDDSGPFREQHHFDRDRSQHSDVNGRSGYPEAQPTFFMPSHYDYQQGKTRKRSNLPKQSTEIMKNWFDQNIANPYPSEDQKAIFSNATGISMTQVSNWFINHRRRCPELRDKRDKTRVMDGGV